MPSSVAQRRDSISQRLSEKTAVKDGIFDRERESYAPEPTDVNCQNRDRKANGEKSTLEMIYETSISYPFTFFIIANL